MIVRRCLLFLVRESFSLDPSGLAMAFSSEELAGRTAKKNGRLKGPAGERLN